MLIKSWMEQIFMKNIIFARQREEGLYAQVAAGNLLLVLASWPISYTQDKTRQHLSLFLYLFISFHTPVFISLFIYFFSFSPISYTQDKARRHLSLFLSFSFHLYSFLFQTISYPCFFLCDLSILKQ